MAVKIRLTLSVAALLMLFLSLQARAQQPGSIQQNEAADRVQIAPESVFKMFREAGMQPANYALTKAQEAKVRHAFSVLPPLHQRILAKHLKSISFMDNMPNTALTSLLDSAGGVKAFNITFRAGLLDETISQWATWKENSCFKAADSAGYRVRVEAGQLDALIYVLMHEATHVVDVVTGITPHFTRKDEIVKPTAFTQGIWRTATLPENRHIDSLLEKTRFRSGQPLAIQLAPQVYKKLSETPFPSLYGMAAWSEDIAELTTIYHLTKKLNQPFHVVVTKGDVELARFEPMKNALVRRRLKHLGIFYAG